MALGPKQMGEAILRNLKEKTGKNLAEWLVIVKQSKLTDKKSIMNLLKKEYQIGHFQAQKIFEQFHDKDMYEDSSTFADQLFSQSSLKGLYDQLQELINNIGEGVRIQPCKTYIPFYHKNQFAIVKPIGKKVIIGLNLPDDFNHSRFEKGKKIASKRINFHTKISTSTELDSELISIIRKAYSIN